MRWMGDHHDGSSFGETGIDLDDGIVAHHEIVDTKEWRQIQH